MNSIFDVFVSVPYSDPDQEVVNYRAKVAQRYVAQLAINNLHAISPIALMHPIITTITEPLSSDYQYWKDLCVKGISACKVVHVIMLPGWDTSVGVTDEIKTALELDKSITYISENYIWVK